MGERLAGKVALITGAARGQGRSHALRLAAEGADVIAIDICANIASNSYDLSMPEDLDETRSGVEALGRRIVTFEADVRDGSELRHAVAKGVDQLGHLDVVVANAGIAPLGAHQPAQAFLDAVQVNLVGVVNTFDAALPHVGPGASLIAIGSTAALRSGSVDASHNGPGGAGYRYGKKEVARFVDVFAKTMAVHRVRVNAVHPTNVNTQMLHSEQMHKSFRPDLDHPTRQEAIESMWTMHPWPQLSGIEPNDVSDAVVYLASDESRYVTGLQLAIDGGSLAGSMLD